MTSHVLTLSETKEESDLDEVVSMASASAKETFNLADGALSKAYARGYEEGLDKHVAMESSDEGFITRIGEKIKSFFKWIRDVFSRFIDWITGRNDPEKQLERAMDKLEKELKGNLTDNLNPFAAEVTDEGVATEDYFHEPAEIQNLRKRRSIYAVRKRALMGETNKLCENRPVFAALFLYKRKEEKEAVEVINTITQQLNSIVTDLLNKVNEHKSLPEATDLILSKHEEFRRISLNVFNNANLTDGAKLFFDEMRERIGFRYVPFEDLLENVRHVMRAITPMRNDVVDVLVKLNTSLKKIKEIDLIKHSQYQYVESGDVIVADYFKALSVIQRMILSLSGAIRIVYNQISAPTEYFRYVSSVMNAYESVYDAIQVAESTTRNTSTETLTFLKTVKNEFR